MNLPGIIVQKIGMSRIQDETGKVFPVTVLAVPHQRVTKLIDSEKHGYTALQLGYSEKSEKNLSKADIGRLRKSSISENFSTFAEIRCDKVPEALILGTSLTADHLDGVTLVDVTGVTKGRGTQGAVRRFGAAVGRMTHGSRFHRRPGSLGTRTTPGRVFKNKHQPGQMGVDQRTLRNLKILDIDKELNIIALKGSVPGFRNGFLLIKPSSKNGDGK